MKSFLLFSVSSVLCVSIAFAQESLFPELDLGEEETQTKETEISTENIIENDEEIQASDAIGEKKISENLNKSVLEIEQKQQVSAPSLEEQQETNETEEGKNEKIFIALNNINANVTTVRAVSTCQADFLVFNGFKKRKLENLDVTLTIGQTQKSFSFKNVDPQKPAGENFIMIGKDCENILKTPQNTITKCKIQGISDKKCIEKVNFIPLNDSPISQNN